MKFLAFTDLHSDEKYLKKLVSRGRKEDIDFILCSGDFSSFGRGGRMVLKALNELDKKVYLIPGNHEEREGMMDELMDGFSNCINFDRKAITIGNYVFLGYGGDGFSQQDAAFRQLARDWYGKHKKAKVVFVTHGPAYGTKLDKLEMGHVGSKDYRQFIERIKPRLAISGHLHETVNTTDSIGETKIVNPGWEGMVIELN
jgi:uncharacterized protein